MLDIGMKQIAYIPRDSKEAVAKLKEGLGEYFSFIKPKAIKLVTTVVPTFWFYFQLILDALQL